jgi:hypothetical protein
MDERNPNESLTIKLLPAAGKPYDSVEEEKVRKVVRERLLRDSREAYHSASAKVKYAADGTPEAIIAFLNRLGTYTADVFTVFIGSDYGVERIESGLAVEDE